MEIKQPSSRKLILTESQFIRQLVSLAVAGAGLMLIIGSIREYGPQAWYRTTYWGGALFMVMGTIYFLLGPWTSRIEVDLDLGQLAYKIRRGVRTHSQRDVPLEQIDQIRIEQLTPQQAKSRQTHFRLSANINGTWTPLNHWAPGNTYDYELGGKRLSAFISAYQRESHV